MAAIAALFPGFKVPPGSSIVDSEKQPRTATIPTMITALIGEWKRSLTFANGAGRTRSKDIANKILEAVRINGGMSFATQNTPNITKITLADPRLIPLPASPATVVVHSFTVGRPTLARLTLSPQQRTSRLRTQYKQNMLRSGMW